MSRCVVSLFSGVGGFDYGFEQAGYETVFQCEIDERCRNVLRRHFPTADQWGDITTLTGEHIVTTLAARGKTPDVIIWGSPCQDLSVAGRRAGLGGERSGLYYEGIRIINEIRKATDNEYPRVSVWENVVGALSSNAGADFGRVIDTLAEAGALVIEWRVLDAQYFGVPQRRRRVFLVSVFNSATAARCPDPLLPVSESVRRDTETSTTSREELAGASSDIANTISASLYHHGSVVNQDANNGHVIVGSLAARDYKGVGSQYVDENKCVVESIAFENSYRDGIRIATEDVSQTLTAKMGTGGNNTPMVAQPVVFADDRRVGPRIFDETIGTLQAFMGTGGNNTPMVAQVVAIGIQGTVINRQDHNGPGGKGHTEENGAMFTLTSSDVHAVAFTTEQTPKWNDDQALTLTGGSPSGGGQPQAVAQPVAFDGYNQTISDVSQTIRADKSDGDHVGMVQEHPTMAVRRLTPLECERLMGWPDDWTDGQADTHRYKQCGNGVASPVAQWVGEQLIGMLDGDMGNLRQSCTMLDSPGGEQEQT